ncbi:unnamed protein product [Hymenolepis diminuta]|uniref:HTH psq-type domain-containing protein n=1 Tax=Hymenolepis diminuta TaxID=6216 RepID=A0A564XUC5_HYMDI|nr:unnamed protein product [Hymenolepis diminuta]
MLKKLNSEQLQVDINENPTCSTRELSKTFNVSCHMAIYRRMKRLGWGSLKGWEMAPPPHTICQIFTSNSI